MISSGNLSLFVHSLFLRLRVLFSCRRCLWGRRDNRTLKRSARFNGPQSTAAELFVGFVKRNRGGIGMIKCTHTRARAIKENSKKSTKICILTFSDVFTMLCLKFCAHNIAYRVIMLLLGQFTMTYRL